MPQKFSAASVPPQGYMSLSVLAHLVRTRLWETHHDYVNSKFDRERIGTGSGG
jgi:hypothetical protein